MENKYTTAELIAFVSDTIGYEKIMPDSDIYNLGIDGDDFHGLIVNFSKKYRVNIDSYIWYFHANDERSVTLGIYSSPSPFKEAARIQVTPEMLTGFANTGRWNVTYPEHELPKRYNKQFPELIVPLVILVVIVIILLLKHYLTSPE